MKAKIKIREIDRRFQDQLNGLLCSVILEPYRDESKQPEPFTMGDFMITPEPEDKEMEKVPKMGDSPEMIKLKLKLMTESFKERRG